MVSLQPRLADNRKKFKGTKIPDFEDCSAIFVNTDQLSQEWKWIHIDPNDIISNSGKPISGWIIDGLHVFSSHLERNKGFTTGKEPGAIMKIVQKHIIVESKQAGGISEERKRHNDAIYAIEEDKLAW